MLLIDCFDLVVFAVDYTEVSRIVSQLLTFDSGDFSLILMIFLTLIRKRFKYVT